LALARRHVDEIVLVSDDEMKAAMRVLWDEMRVLVEPAGAAAVAAVLGERVDKHARVAILVCGANLDNALASYAFG
jgi:threonine dehydratase